MKIIVTGGAGMIGINLVDRLLSDDHSVYVIDDFSTSAEVNIKRLREMDQNSEIDLRLVKADIADLQMDNDPSGGPFWYDELWMDYDLIFHLACPASPKQYQKTPFTTIETCTKGTYNILESVRSANEMRMKHRHLYDDQVKPIRVILASTSEIYGEPLEHPQREEYRGNVSVNGPRSCYDEGKRAMEAMAIAHREQYGTDVGIIRIFNTYGPGMRPDDGRVISNFIVNILEKKPVVIYGDGMQTRSFCYVDDLVEGLIRMGNNWNEVGPINLGNPNEIPILSLVQTISKCSSNNDSDIDHYDYPLVTFEESRTDDPTRRCPVIERARDRLNGWEPKISLEDGLIKTIAYFRNL